VRVGRRPSKRRPRRERRRDLENGVLSSLFSVPGSTRFGKREKLSHIFRGRSKKQRNFLRDRQREICAPNLEKRAEKALDEKLASRLPPVAGRGLFFAARSDGKVSSGTFPEL
jgi:hypothetical protein